MTQSCECISIVLENNADTADIAETIVTDDPALDESSVLQLLQRLLSRGLYDVSASHSTSLALAEELLATCLPRASVEAQHT